MSLSISVITPSYNQGQFIERTISSVLNQNVPSLEYVVVDGASTDETVRILKKYDGDLRWISEEDNGQTEAVNKGLKMTKGDIIGWLNSDDIYYPGALEAVLRYFEKHPRAHVVYGDADHIDLDDRVIEPYYTESWHYEKLKEVCFLCQPAVFIRRRVIEKFGLLNEDLQYCMDYEYWLRLGAKIPFFKIDRRLAGSRIYEKNKTMGERTAVHKEINDMLRNRLGTVPDKWIYNYSHALVDNIVQNRTKSLNDLLYVWMLIGISTGGFLYWRNRVPVQSLKTMGRWAGSSFRKAFGISHL